MALTEKELEDFFKLLVRLGKKKKRTQMVDNITHFCLLNFVHIFTFEEDHPFLFGGKKITPHTTVVILVMNSKTTSLTLS